MVLTESGPSVVALDEVGVDGGGARPRRPVWSVGLRCGRVRSTRPAAPAHCRERKSHSSANAPHTPSPRVAGCHRITPFAVCGRYSAAVPQDLDDQPTRLSRPDGGERRPTARRASRGVLPWLGAIAIVLVLAALAGLATAWLVANMRAVPPPVGDVPTPRTSPGLSMSPGPSDGLPTALPTDPPRRTPTPSPVETVEPTPFIHVVERGESLSEIAELYQVELNDILTLNEIRNPNRIQVGQEIEIPGYGVIPTPRPRN